MMRWLVRFLGFALVMLAWVKVASAQSRCPFNTTGTIEAGDANQDGRLKNGPTSTCAAPTTAPAVLTPQQQHRFDKYTLKNRNAAAQCVTIAVTGTSPAGVQSAAYAPTFDPTNPQTNYLGDGGGISADNNTLTYSVTIPALSNFEVTVNEIGNGGGTYSLAITDCGAIVVTSITPNAGPVAGGTNVTIKGSGFLAGVGVTIGGTTATNVLLVDEGTITATTPAGAAGLANVVVTNTDATTATLTNGFEYTAPAGTNLALASNANPSVTGQNVTFTATLTSVAGTPTGNITFKEGANTLGTTALAAGVATFSTATLAVGTHTITAEYAGDGAFLAATSAPVSQVVNKAQTTATIISSKNPSAVGEAITFTVTVAAVAPGTGIPTGTVTFNDASTSIGSATLDGTGKATLSTSTLAAGTHAIAATYGGDAKYLTSATSSLAQQVNGATTDAGTNDGGTSGSSGTSGTSGTSGASGSGGTSGTSGTSGASGTPDAGNNNNAAPVEGGGCDCREAPTDGSGLAFFALGTAAVLVAMRRRRR